MLNSKAALDEYDRRLPERNMLWYMIKLSRIISKMEDGFPFHDNNADPYNHSPVQNNVIECYREVIEKCAKTFREKERKLLADADTADNLTNRLNLLGYADDEREMAEMCEKALK